MSDNWKVGKQKGLEQNIKIENAILVGLVKDFETKEQVIEYLDELEFLAQTAGAVTIKRYTQGLKHPDSYSYIGKGKVEEIKTYIEFSKENGNDIDMVIFDDDLTGKQTQNLERVLERKIIDRSSLILDIFAKRAQTAQAKNQVELAQLCYLLPKLRGLWTHLERQRGGIGMRGPGEQEIETDRRIVKEKIALLKKKLEKIDQQSKTQRKNRGEMLNVALVGYTNVGKSTLMTLISKSDVFAENKLFATLDTTVRKVTFDTMPFLLTDTVGFIRKLPHHLVESFKSTLDETRDADLLLHIVDISHPQYMDQLEIVQKTLAEIGVAEKPTILVINKIDQYRQRYFDKFLEEEIKTEIMEELKANIVSKFQYPVIFISAKNNENVDELKEILKQELNEMYLVRYPYRPKYF